KVRERLSETLSRWCVNHADLVILTHEEYRRTLLTSASHRGHIIHASWLDDENILSQADAAESWRSKSLTSGMPLRLLFAGRLERSKGVMLLLEAMKLLSRESVPIELHLLGQGELSPECEQAAKSW